VVNAQQGKELIIQSGANQGDTTGLNIDRISTETLGIRYSNLSTQVASANAITEVNNAPPWALTLTTSPPKHSAAHKQHIVHLLHFAIDKSDNMYYYICMALPELPPKIYDFEVELRVVGVTLL
jgi:hypothetical protein